MANILPAQAVVISGCIRPVLLGGPVILASELLRYDSDTAKYILASAGGTLENSLVQCMALETGGLDDTIKALFPSAVVDLGAVLQQGEAYALSTTIGGRIALYSDLVISGEYASFVGIARTTSELIFSVLNSKTALP